jgi:hypothetical protein
MPSTLFLRTLSQALQGLTPIALALAWLLCTGNARAGSAIRRGLVLSVPATIAGAWLFQQASRQALIEAVLASIAVVTAATARRIVAGWAIMLAVVLIVTRQTMEIAAALKSAAIDVRLLDPTMQIVAGFVAGAGLAWVLYEVLVRLPDRAVLAATRAFVAIFLALGVLYAFHEFAEAGWLLRATSCTRPSSLRSRLASTACTSATCW